MSDAGMFEGLEPVNRQATAAVIADRIRAGITAGRFRAGDQLGEAQLAAALGVSRGPVREALQRLIQEGLLRNEPNRGVFVEGLDLDELRDVYFVRTIIERAAADRLLDRKDAGVLDELEHCCDEMHRATNKRDVMGVAHWDLEFHKTLTVAAQSRRLTRMFETLLTETQLALTLGGRELQLGDTVIDEHRAILDALRSGDRRRSLQMVERHMESGVRRRQDDLVSQSSD